MRLFYNSAVVTKSVRRCRGGAVKKSQYRAYFEGRSHNTQQRLSFHINIISFKGARHKAEWRWQTQLPSSKQ